MSLAAELGDITTKPDNVVQNDKGSSPPKFDVTREEHWGGPLISNPAIWDASDTSGRQETGCTGISARPPHTGGTADEPVVTGFLGLMSRKEVGLQ